MVGDITYIPTWEGWLFLATVIDCHTKAVVGWAMDDNYKTPLIEQAIDMAARNHPLADEAIFHSDRGSNYTSSTFAETLKSMASDSPSAEPAFATITRWPSHSSPRSRTSASTAPSTRLANMHVATLPDTSNSATIPTRATQDSVPDPAASPRRVPETAVRSVN